VNRQHLHVCVKEPRVKIRISGVARTGLDGIGPYRNIQDHGVGLGEGLGLRGLKSSQDNGLEDVSNIDVATEKGQHLQSVADIAEMAIDVGLGVAVPCHKVAKFCRK